jgi:hypothetical protein
MGRTNLLVVAATFCGVLALPSSLWAGDPLSCIPPSAQLVLVADNPRKLAEAVTGLDAFQKAQKLPQYRVIYDSAAARRGLQFLALFEKELGAKWPELLDQLGGGGVALGFQFGPDPAPMILVLHGTVESKAKKAFDTAVRVVEDELARQGAKEKVQWSKLAGQDVMQVGTLRAVRFGATVLISNNEKMLEDGATLGTTERHELPRKDVFKFLPKDPLAWVWIDFASVKQSKAAKDFFDATRKDFVQTLAAGSTIDCLKRSDFVAAGLYKEPTGFRLSVRLPAGRSKFPAEYQLHVPPKGEPGSLPLLEPPGTLYSQSFHLDIGFLWKHREKLLNAETRAGLEKFEKDTAKFMPSGVKFGDILEAWGPYHRIVVANHDTMPYKKHPAQRFPAFGYVASTRDPKFSKSLDATLRTAAIIATLSFGMKMTEHTYDDTKITAYRFPEDKELADDPEGIRFNFEPCFATVGDQFVAASTVELCKKLITELKAPQKSKPAPAVWRARVSAKGAAVSLASQPEPLITEAILARGVGLEDARKEVAELVAWVKTLGTARIELDIAEKEYKLDLVWNLDK